ncbi:glycoside hydrolase family 28 protein [Teratosphaeria destructans]|uniref:galacturonan 1,4-alpha-galacturonidase n=1 Tax=Teratosphaeria destructans TaxID=418781 RepID=A0A9W7SP67_9PEZI|nr:glycoside hydrolase family 28 protein [Teratosphaeria destructans]
MYRALFLCLSAFISRASSYVVNNGSTCYLYPESLIYHQPVDDSPSIQQAFELCGINGTVIFTAGNTFQINQILNTTNLQNVRVEVEGELLWSDNIPYWLSHSIGVVFQDQSTAWLIGGENLTFIGRPGSSLNGNGQAWYTENKGNANQPGRPITITFYNSTNLFIDGISIIQPQFWATFVTYSKNVTFTNIHVNATSTDPNGSTVNTDGTDTWNSQDVLIANWTVVNGDDCVAAKGNTTNMLVRNVTCYGGSGMTIGSVGQYPLTPDYDENIVFEDITLINSTDGAYIKTWQGQTQENTSNGDAGGGGSGLVRNITFRNFQVENVVIPIEITQCIYSEAGGADICDTSKMQIEDVTFENFTGTSRYNLAASLHCAATHPCPDIFFKDIDISSVNQTLGLPLWNTTLQQEVYQCANIVNQNTTSGIPCNHWAPGDFGQTTDANVQ